MKTKKKPVQVDVKALRKLLRSLSHPSKTQKTQLYNTALVTAAVVLVIGVFAVSPTLQNYFRSQPSKAGSLLLPGGGSLIGGDLTNGTGNLFGPYPWRPQGTLSLVSDYNAWYPSTDGDKIVYVKENDLYAGVDIYLYDSVAGTTTPIDTNISSKGSPDISNSYVVWKEIGAYTPTEGHADIYLYDINSATKKNITNYVSAQANEMAIDDNYVVFDMSYHDWVWGDMQNEVRLYDINTGITQTLFSFWEKDEVIQRIGIDNDKIVISFWGDSNIKLYNITTEQLTYVYQSINDQSLADISGNIVVWSEKVSGHTDIYAYNLYTGIKETVYTFKLGESNCIFPSVYDDLIVWGIPNTYIGGVWIKKISVPPFIINVARLLYDQPDEFEEPFSISVSKNKIVWQSQNSIDGPHYGEGRIFMFTLNN